MSISVEKIIRIAGDLGGKCDNPFNDPETTVLRQSGTSKWFGILLKIPQYYFGGDDDEIGLNLKCPPDIGFLMREKYSGIKPAYHMNKEHWITVRLNGSVPLSEIEGLITLSYHITAPKSRKGK